RRNGRPLQASGAATCALDGAERHQYGHRVFTHGMEMGITRNGTHDLETATDELLNAFAQDNPRLSRPSRYDRATIGNRRRLRTILSNVSEATGAPANIAVSTITLRDGNLFY